MRGAVIPTSAHQGIPITFALRRGITVPRLNRNEVCINLVYNC